MTLSVGEVGQNRRDRSRGGSGSNREIGQKHLIIGSPCTGCLLAPSGPLGLLRQVQKNQKSPISPTAKSPRVPGSGTTDTAVAESRRNRRLLLGFEGSATENEKSLVKLKTPLVMLTGHVSLAVVAQSFRRSIRALDVLSPKLSSIDAPGARSSVKSAVVLVPSVTSNTERSNSVCALASRASWAGISIGI